MPAIVEFKEYSMGFRDDDGNVFNLLDKVSFNVQPGRALGIVGESGCGKSMTSLSMMRLLPDAAVVAAKATRRHFRRRLPALPCQTASA